LSVYIYSSEEIHAYSVSDHDFMKLPWDNPNV